MNKSYKTIFLLVLTAILGGGVGAMAKISLREIPPIPFTFFRFLTTTIVLLPLFYLQKQRFSLQNFKKLFWVLLFGAGNIFVFIFGLRLTTASSSQVVYAFSPIIAGLLTYFLFGERLGKRRFWGIIIGFIGTLIVVLYPVISGQSSINGTIAGNLLVLLAVISHSIYSVLSKEKQKEFSPIEVTTYSIIFTLLISSIILPFNMSGYNWVVPSTGAILSILYAGVLGTAAYFLIFQYSIKQSSAVTATMVLYLQPIFGFVWAMALLGERLNIGLIIGTILAFAGVYLATTRDRREA
jgi:drug/metabolite transporter (DMT)-like permease